MSARLSPLLVGLAMACVAGLPALAGPWAREEGRVFLSFGVALEDQAERVLTTGAFTPSQTDLIFAEIGMPYRWTLGVSASAGDTGGLTVASARRTTTPGDATWQVAYEFGAAARRQDGTPDAQRLGLLGASVGRGLGLARPGWPGPLAFDGGWTNLDARSYFDLDTGTLAVRQVEATLGLNGANGVLGILAVKVEDWPNAEPLATLRPALAIPILDRSHVHIGGRLDLSGGQTMGLSVGLWHEF